MSKAETRKRKLNTHHESDTAIGNYLSTQHEADKNLSSVQKILNTPCTYTRLFLILFPIRLFNALTIKTFFQPDEFYQCLELAHNLVFKNGYITWEWKEHLRSSIHPLIYALGYSTTRLFPQEWETQLVLLIPKVTGSLLATIGEIALYKFVLNYTMGDYRLSQLLVWLSVLNPFNQYFITRSFSNSLEMILTTIALANWPWNLKSKSFGNLAKQLLVSCGFAFISIIVRPTNAILWGFLGVNFLVKNRAHNRTTLKLILMIIVEFSLITSLNTVLDYIFYEELTFPLYNFFEFNVFKNLSIFYGTAPWHFYILQAIPLILMTYLPFFIYSYRQQSNKDLKNLVIFELIAFSLISHKEIRFIYPLQPIFIMLTATSVIKLGFLHQARRKWLIIIIGLNLIISIFFTQIHERGVIDVIDYLRQNDEVKSIGFLTPCHSTPWQSQLHRADISDENSWFLTCEPPLHLALGNAENIKQYRDESDQFFDDPNQFLNEHFPSLHESNLEQPGKNQYDHFWPSHVIIFEPLKELMDDYFSDSNYHECRRFFNTYFHWDDRRAGDIIVYCDGTS